MRAHLDEDRLPGAQQGRIAREEPRPYEEAIRARHRAAELIDKPITAAEIAGKRGHRGRQEEGPEITI